MGFDNECILFIQYVAAEYFCPVCGTLVYPNEALQTPCTHLYCKPCLVHIANSTQICPYDGDMVTEAASKPLVETNKILADKIGNVVVCCNYHRSGCKWRGPLSDCIVHRSGCAFGNFLVICTKCGIQIVHREAEDHAQICNVNLRDTYQQLQVPQFQQSFPQIHYSQPQLPPHSEGPPQFQFFPQFQNLQSQQVLQAPPQQHPLTVHPSTGSILPGQVPAQSAQPAFPLRGQAPGMPPVQQHTNPHSQPGLPAHQIQPPMPQQYVQLPHVFAGYTSSGPPQLMQQPPLGYVQPQSLKNYDMDADGPRANNFANHASYQPGSFTFFPQYQLGGSLAPCSAPMFASEPNNFANHSGSFEPQYPGLHSQYSQTQTQSQCHPDVFPVKPAQHLDQSTGSTRQEFQHAGSFYSGDSDSFNNMRKRKSMGWCLICEVDCESLHGLKMHCQTHDHQQLAMDRVNDIKRKCAHIPKTSISHSGHGEESKSRSGGSHGYGSKS